MPLQDTKRTVDVPVTAMHAKKPIQGFLLYPCGWFSFVGDCSLLLFFKFAIIFWFI